MVLTRGSAKPSNFEFELLTRRRIKFFKTHRFEPSSYGVTDYVREGHCTLLKKALLVEDKKCKTKYHFTFVSRNDILACPLEAVTIVVDILLKYRSDQVLSSVSPLGYFIADMVKVHAKGATKRVDEVVTRVARRIMRKEPKCHNPGTSCQEGDTLLVAVSAQLRLDSLLDWTLSLACTSRTPVLLRQVCMEVKMEEDVVSLDFDSFHAILSTHSETEATTATTYVLVPLFFPLLQHWIVDCWMANVKKEARSMPMYVHRVLSVAVQKAVCTFARRYFQKRGEKSTPFQNCSNMFTWGNLPTIQWTSEKDIFYLLEKDTFLSLVRKERADLGKVKDIASQLLRVTDKKALRNVEQVRGARERAKVVLQRYEAWSAKTNFIFPERVRIVSRFMMTAIVSSSSPYYLRNIPPHMMEAIILPYCFVEEDEEHS